MYPLHLEEIKTFSTIHSRDRTGGPCVHPFFLYRKRGFGSVLQRTPEWYYMKVFAKGLNKYMSMESGMPTGAESENKLHDLLDARLKEVKAKVAADYELPPQLWRQMVVALEKGAPASGGAFSEAELEEFNDATQARLGDYLAEATRGMVPGNHGVMFDSQGTVIGRVDSRPEAERKAEEERGL